MKKFVVLFIAIFTLVVMIGFSGCTIEFSSSNRNHSDTDDLLRRYTPGDPSNYADPVSPYFQEP